VSVPSARAAQALSSFARSAAVRRASPTTTLRKAGEVVNDPLYLQQWALPKISWDRAYAEQPIAGSARVAILDTGIDAGSPDLVGRIAASVSFTGGDPL